MMGLPCTRDSASPSSLSLSEVVNVSLSDQKKLNSAMQGQFSGALLLFDIKQFDSRRENDTVHRLKLAFELQF